MVCRRGRGLDKAQEGPAVDLDGEWTTNALELQVMQQPLNVAMFLALGHQYRAQRQYKQARTPLAIDASPDKD